MGGCRVGWPWLKLKAFDLSQEAQAEARLTQPSA